MAIKTGVDHSNNKERCSAGNLDDLLWKYCKSRYADLSCSDVHWNVWRMRNALWLGSEVCNWYRLPISPIWRRRSTNVSKSLQSLFCILHPACVLLLVCSLLFTLSLHFTPGPQSAFYTDRIDIWNERIDPSCIAGARDTIYLVVGNKIHAQRVMFQASAGWLWTENYISNNSGSFSINFFFSCQNSWFTCSLFSHIFSIYSALFQTAYSQQFGDTKYSGTLIQWMTKGLPWKYVCYKYVYFIYQRSFPYILLLLGRRTSLVIYTARRTRDSEAQRAVENFIKPWVK